MKWIQELNRWRHDWPKSELSLGLGHLEKVLAELVDHPGFDEHFFREVLPQWSRYRREALWLADTVADEMSPRRLFEEEPLSAMPELRTPCIVDLLHVLWANRIGVFTRVDRVRAAIRNCDEKHSRLAAFGAVQNEIEARSAVIASLVAFRQTCMDVSNAVGDLPTTVTLL